MSFFPHEGPGLVGLDLPGLDAPDHAVVKLLGVLAEAGREAQDGVEADAAQPGGGAAAGALGEVAGDGDEGVPLGAQAKQGGVGPLGEVPAAPGAAQAADALAPAGPAVQAQVAGATPAVGGAVGVGAGQVRELFGAHR